MPIYLNIIFVTLLSLEGAGVQPIKLRKVSNVGEYGLRTLIQKRVRPSYPVSSQRAGKEGVAVANVKVNESGSVERVNILQAPDKEINKSVDVALRQWRFNVPKGFELLEGVVIIYFRKTTAGWLVSYPEEF